ncbi:MAG TPA: isocitrate lyase [Actinomycetota bacterium]|jgi:isocitrate lyase|nr:isocitrate lyase [Actinomycetota bacterium]
MEIAEQIKTEAAALQERWDSETRWTGIERPYTAEEVIRLRGRIRETQSFATQAADKLWNLITTEDFIAALGCLTGNQAVECVKAGLHAIYLSGWQVAADANLSGQTYPDQSLYPANSVPAVVQRINNALRRADQIAWSTGREADFLAPIVADAEAGFGGPLNAFELMSSMIKAGAAGVHFEDQLSSEKKCGHLGGKVLIPTPHFIRTLTAARLAADVLDVPTVLVARTDALAATLLTSDIDERDRRFTTGERTEEGFFHTQEGIDAAIARAISYAPYADMLWCETSTPDMDEAKTFAEAVHKEFPGKLLAYNCSPSFNWKKTLDDAQIATFQKELGAMGYRFQFITLAGFHALNASMFDLAKGYATEGMTAYVKLQQQEFAMEPDGYTAAKHQAEVGTGWFDQVSQTIAQGTSSTLALEGSTEADQF